MKFKPGDFINREGDRYYRLFLEYKINKCRCLAIHKETKKIHISITYGFMKDFYKIDIPNELIGLIEEAKARIL